MTSPSDVLHDICAAEGGLVHLQYHTDDGEWFVVRFILIDDGRFGGCLESVDDGSRYNILVNTSEWFSESGEQRVPIYAESVLDEPIERTALPAAPQHDPFRWVVAVQNPENSSLDIPSNQ